MNSTPEKPQRPALQKLAEIEPVGPDLLAERDGPAIDDERAMGLRIVRLARELRAQTEAEAAVWDVTVADGLEGA